MKAAEASYFEGSRNRLIRWLGGPLYGRRRGRVKALNDLARAALPVPAGVVLPEGVHELFLKASNVLERLRVAAQIEVDPEQQVSEIRSHYRSVPMQEEQSRERCHVLIELGAPIVTVLVPIEAPRVGDHLGKNKVALYEVEPFGREGHKGISHLTLTATSALGDRPRIIWGLEDDIWYVLSIEMNKGEETGRGWLP